MKSEWRFGENDSYALAYEIENPKAIVQIVHGMTEHIERYEEFAKFLNSQGFCVFGHDNLGHGKTVKNPNDFGYFPEDYWLLIENAKELTKEIRKKYKDKKIILLGHSFGSLIVRYYASKYSKYIDGLVIMGTTQESFIKTNLAILFTYLIKAIFGGRHRSKLLTFLTVGLYSLKFNKDEVPSWLTRDKEKYDIRMKDNLCKFIPTVNMFLGIFKIGKYVFKEKNIRKIPKLMPILLISGENDPVGKYSKAVKELNNIMMSCDFENMQMFLYDGARHEILNDINRKEVFVDIAHWIDANVL